MELGNENEELRIVDWRARAALRFAHARQAALHSPPCLRGRRGRFEIGVLALLVAASVAAQGSTSALSALQFDRAAIAAGQVWRVVTGNFVHYGWGHLAANLGAFAALCWMARGRGRGALGITALGSLAVGIAVYLCGSGVGVYRGISGVDCGLLAWVLVTMAVQDGGWKGAGWIGVLLLVAAKAVYEQVSGVLLLPTSAPAGVEVVGVTHVVGLALGAGMAMATRQRRRSKDDIRMSEGAQGGSPNK